MKESQSPENVFHFAHKIYPNMYGSCEKIVFFESLRKSEASGVGIKIVSGRSSTIIFCAGCGVNPEKIFTVNEQDNATL